MNFATLPRWAPPVPGESCASWLAATGRLQLMGETDWLAWVHAASDEPERPQRGTVWANLPRQLGDIRSITPVWLLHPRQRKLFCAECCAVDGGRRRWITRTVWLDARRLVCAQHAVPLVHASPELGPEPGYARCMAQPEPQTLTEWLNSWCRWEGACKRWRLESLWRRDLVHLLVRNWHRQSEHSPAALAAWELHLLGWDYQERSPVFPPGEPARLGTLPAAERIGALLMAHRYWQALRGIGQDEILLRLPPAAWQWFLGRWWRRASSTNRRHLEHVAAQCSDTGQRLGRNRVIKEKPH